MNTTWGRPQGSKTYHGVANWVDIILMTVEHEEVYEGIQWNLMFLDNLSENFKRLRRLNDLTIGSHTSERKPNNDIQQRNKRQMSKRESSEWLNRVEEKSKWNDY